MVSPENDQQNFFDLAALVMLAQQVAALANV
jgi:hypothetical protein